MSSTWSGLRPVGLRVGRHRSTTAHLCSVFPAQTAPGLGAQGVYIGTDGLAGGGSMCFDPFVAVTNGLLANPNMLIVGEPGFGKSSAVKSFVLRDVGVLGAPDPLTGRGGRWVAICDPKGEYEPLATALGLQRVRLYPGGPERINPLDAGPSGADRPEELAMRRTAMVGALLASVLARRLDPAEEAAVSAAAVVLGTRPPAGAPTLSDVASLLGAPTAEMAAQAGIEAAPLAEACATARLGLGRLLSRDLRGMFDGPSTVRTDWSGRGIVLDLSGVHSDPDALAAVMIPTTAWLQSLMADPDPGAPRRIQVIEECWAMLRQERVAFYLQSCWKLCRAYGVANIAVAHRLSDLRSQADDGTATAKVAMGLLADTQTRIIFRQSADQTPEAKSMLGLNSREADLLPRLARGVALWKVGEHTAVVTHRLSSAERALCETNAALVTA